MWRRKKKDAEPVEPMEQLEKPAKAGGVRLNRALTQPAHGRVQRLNKTGPDRTSRHYPTGGRGTRRGEVGMGTVANRYCAPSSPCHPCYHRRPSLRHRANQPWAVPPAFTRLRLGLVRPTTRLFPLVCATGDGDGAAAESNPSSSFASPPVSSALPPDSYPLVSCCVVYLDITFDIKLPRRNLLVEFTCDPCGERTKRLINRVAYEKGTIFLQCGGCQVYHKFVDNLGLVVEYDLREETDADSDVT
ncbi:DNL zinc finger [Musa troglodytarum]|uniref:DNL zinc finger n=1 Tax=Musa troglodytarum TaxID=320322 RepID=A0A9E7ECQ8_9LILI|nr:DNL zinc finger [Musa troglodytarum]